MFKIGDFSRVCRVSVSALRYYADIGLLEPANIDKFTGYRYYSLSQLPRLNRILALKDLGLSLSEIKTILASDTDLNIDELRGMLKLKQAELQHELAERQAQLNRVSARLQQIQQEGKMPEQDVILKTIDPLYVLSYRFTAKSPEELGVTLRKIYPTMFGKGIMLAGAPGILYYDEEFSPDNINVEVIYPVPPSVKDAVVIDETCTMSPCELPAAEVASIIHKGEYGNGLEASYVTLGQWIESNQYRMTGPARELYLSSPDSPEGAITEIQFPIAKA